MEQQQAVAGVLAEYPLRADSIRPLGAAGGFSGAEFWRVAAGNRQLCLRRWPAEHPSPPRLQYIHRLLRHVHQLGVAQVPVPLATRGDGTFVPLAGHLWELTPWMPGQADFHQNPAPARLVAALELLARFHVAAASLEQASGTTAELEQRALKRGLQPAENSPEHGNQPGESPGLAQRLELTERLLSAEAEQIEQAVARGSDPEVQSRARRILARFSVTARGVYASHQRAARLQVPLQPCIRDIWHDHVLFLGDRVTGLVDFGAVRTECVAADLARLLGSLVGGDRSGWQLGLEAYQRTRPLLEQELQLVSVFHESNALLSGMNWLRWIYLDRRQFPSRERILARLDQNLQDLEWLRGQPASGTGRVAEFG